MENMIFDFLFGIALGLVLVGTSILRTINCGRGEVLKAVSSSTVHNIAYFFSIYYVVEYNLAGFAGVSLGAIMISGYIAWRNK